MTGYLALAVTWPPAAALLWSLADRLFPSLSLRRVLRRGRLEIFLLDWSIAALLLTLVLAWSRLWLPAAVSAAAVVLAAVIRWWLRRRKRRRAASLIGSRGKALRDALVRRMREQAVPRPVLRPAPDGAS